MPSIREVNSALNRAERKPIETFNSVFAQVKGIAQQGVWQTRRGELIKADKLDWDTIDYTLLRIIEGDHAFFYKESEGDISPELLQQGETFDTMVMAIMRTICVYIDRHRDSRPRLCASLIYSMQEDLHKYWCTMWD